MVNSYHDGSLWSCLDVASPHLCVLLLQVLLGHLLLHSHVLQQQLIKGTNLALFLDISHLVAHLHQTIYLRDICLGELSAIGGSELHEGQFEEPSDKDGEHVIALNNYLSLQNP